LPRGTTQIQREEDGRDFIPSFLSALKAGNGAEPFLPTQLERRVSALGFQKKCSEANFPQSPWRLPARVFACRLLLPGLVSRALVFVIAWMAARTTKRICLATGEFKAAP